jgi:hypothetical protein
MYMAKSLLPLCMCVSNGTLIHDLARFYTPNLRAESARIREKSGLGLTSTFLKFALAAKVHSCELFQKPSHLNSCCAFETILDPDLNARPIFKNPATP